MRSAMLTLGSLSLTAAVVFNAYYQKKQFYPSVVYITKSNPSMAVMYLQALVMVILTGEIMRKVFFGQLRAAELEHLIDRSWYVVTETCLAFTIFRDDFSPKFVALFTLLLFLKCFHWLADDRVDYMERSPVISALFHIRVVSLLVVLGALDSFFVHLAYQSMVAKGASVQLVFGFEYAILLTVVANIFIKYVLHTVDLQSENPWENKAVFLLYTELVIGLVKLLLYMLFVCIMIKIHTFPLFAIRPMYLTMRSFKKAFNDVIMSRRAIRNMNTLYPDATAEELATLDNVCIICREEMVTASCKKLPCNHIFHTSCLRSWFQRQQTCPTCRMDVLRFPQAMGAGAGARGRPNIGELIRAAAAAARQNQTPTPAAANQPPQPQQAPMNGPVIFPNMMPGPFPMWPMMPPGFVPPANMHPQASVGNPTPSDANSNERLNQATGGGHNSGTSSGSSTTNASRPQPPPSFAPGPMPPMFIPPFFFPTQIPPPVAPPGFGSLSDVELHRMEGTQRQHVEARVQCLRNIQTFLDAAVMQMEQYTSVVASLNFNANESVREEPAEASNMQREHEPSTSTSTQSPQSDGSTKASNGDVRHLRDAEAGACVSNVEPVDDTPLDEREALRKRRLQKFTDNSLPTKNGVSD